MRKLEQLFVVEGAKNVLELLESDYNLHSLYATPEFLDQHSILTSKADADIFRATIDQLSKAGSLMTNQSAIALAKIKENQPLFAGSHEYVLILDEVMDPGNLGTIIRICDWYGVKKIVASNDCVDLYNQKVIAASMGSFTRVSVFYTDLVPFLAELELTIYGAFLEGEDIHSIKFENGGYIVLGNESKGIREELFTSINKRLFIPGKGGAESLNVGVAAGVILDNISRG